MKRLLLIFTVFLLLTTCKEKAVAESSEEPEAELQFIYEQKGLNTVTRPQLIPLPENFKYHSLT